MLCAQLSQKHAAGASKYAVVMRLTPKMLRCNHAVCRETCSWHSGSEGLWSSVYTLHTQACTSILALITSVHMHFQQALFPHSPALLSDVQY